MYVLDPISILPVTSCNFGIHALTSSINSFPVFWFNCYELCCIDANSAAISYSDVVTVFVHTVHVSFFDTCSLGLHLRSSFSWILSHFLSCCILWSNSLHQLIMHTLYCHWNFPLNLQWLSVVAPTLRNWSTHYFETYCCQWLHSFTTNEWHWTDIVQRALAHHMIQ